MIYALNWIAQVPHSLTIKGKGLGFTSDFFKRCLSVVVVARASEKIH